MPRLILALAVTAGFVVVVAGAQPALGAVPVIHRESLVGVVIHSDCMEDVEIIEGDIQFVLLEHGNQNRAIETFHVGTSGVAGVGLTTGATYRYAEASIGEFSQGVDGSTQNIAVAHLTLVGTGTAGAATATFIVVWRIDADGNFHLATEQSRMTCSG
jgi:hypothetical protein